MSTRACLVALFVLVSRPVAAAPARRSAPPTRVSVATDLAPWALDGFSVIGAVEPAAWPRWRLGAELWSMRLPRFAVELAGANAGEGWRHDVTIAGTLYVDRFVGGWHVGGFVNAMRARIERGGASAPLHVLEVIGRVGYRWLPFGPRGLAIDPWLGLGPQVALGARPVLDGERYALAPVQLVATVHVGARF
ncbi:MAG: hypothetical protein K8W52_14795 [Deltaproteobacteria bacterium]|nr:hypothetical protein [Deltaproteobacteria bacterium]